MTKTHSRNNRTMKNTDRERKKEREKERNTQAHIKTVSK